MGRYSGSLVEEVLKLVGWADTVAYWLRRYRSSLVEDVGTEAHWLETELGRVTFLNQSSGKETVSQDFFSLCIPPKAPPGPIEDCIGTLDDLMIFH